MVTTGNAYVPSDDQDADGLPDPGTNVMNVGAINNCLTTAPPGNAVTHLHNVQLIMQNVENLVGWQVRANFIGDRMRIDTVNFTPFTDPITGQGIGFTNLPYDLTSFLHRSVTSAGGTGPAAPPDLSNTPQTHIFGATYDLTQNFQVSGDSPYIADEGTQTYDAPTGGILASVGLQVVGNESTTGPNGAQASLFMNLDDNNPNPPGSRAIVFNGTGTTDINIAPANLGDGFHGEGATCVAGDCTNVECPPTPTATPCPFCVPSTEVTFVNDTGQSASELHIELPEGATTSTTGVVQNAPGCPSPTVHSTPPLDEEVTVVWGIPCVDPGESVRLVFVADSQLSPAPEVSCFYWTRLRRIHRGAIAALRRYIPQRDGTGRERPAHRHPQSFR